MKKGDVFYSFLYNDKHHVVEVIVDGENEVFVHKYWSYRLKSWQYNIMHKYVFEFNVRSGMYYIEESC